MAAEGHTGRAEIYIICLGRHNFSGVKIAMRAMGFTECKKHETDLSFCEQLIEKVSEEKVTDLKMH